MDKETLTLPKLVNVNNFKLNVPVEKSKNMKWNLNKILLFLFVLFLIFFFYNCKYGMFKCMDDEPIPYSLVYTKSLI
jgi:hypothetical protein